MSKNYKGIPLNKVAGYLFALVVVVFVTVLKLMIPGIGTGTPTLLYLTAVILLAYAGGTGPAVFVLGLSSLIFPTVFTKPVASLVLNIETIAQILVYIFNGLIIIALVRRTQEYEQELQVNNKQLLDTNNRVTSLMSKALDTSFDRKRIDSED